MIRDTLGLEPVTNEEAIYHYTKDFNILNILQKDGIHLWATHITDFEDKKEFKYAQRLWIKSCHDMFQAREISELYYKLIKNIRPSFTHMFMTVMKSDSGRPFDFMVTPCFGQCKWYIICFSKAADSRYMWDHFSMNGDRFGYNIGFFGNDFINLTNIYLRHVTYDPKRQENAVKDTIRNYYYDFIHRIKDQYEIKDYLQGHLTDWSVFFKSKEFENEEEIRLAIPYVEDRDDIDYQVKSLNDGNKDVPKHIDMVMKGNTVSSIISGPCITDEDVKNMEMKVRANGYNKLLLLKSLV